FFDRGGKRHALRLGEVSRTTAETVRGHIGTLEDSRRFGVAPNRADLMWLDRLDDDFHDKIAGFGLAPPRRRFGRVCDYID
ncbi:hypothetical protein ACI3QN_13450, partial [Propionibacterium freudenreichii]|uniref:hypothetical protein n=1 Tax=Propionibacterium freudenreichii TaxID=1744 RepID=UPI00385291A9